MMGRRTVLHRTKKIAALTLSGLLSSVLLCSCGSKGTKDADISKKVEEFNASISKSEAVDTSKNKDIVIGSVNMGMNGEWYSEVMNGISDASADLGVTVKMMDSEGDLEKEKKNIAQLLDEGMDALVISPINSTGSVEMLKKVKAKGIPIVAWNTTVNMDVTTAVLVNSTNLGGDTGNYVCEYIKTNNIKDAKMIIIGNTTYDVGVARCDGYKAAIRDLVDEGVIEIVAEEEAETFDASVETTGKLLKEHPEATMLWSWNQPSLLGAIEAARQAGRQDLMIMGADMSMELAEDMLGDEVDVQAITTQLPYNMGYKAVVSAVKAVNGENPDKTVVIPLETYTKKDKDLIERYLTAHENLVEYKEEFGKRISK